MSDLTATVNVPIGSNIKTFVAINSKHVDDWDPTYWTDFEINDGEALPTAIAGVTPAIACLLYTSPSPRDATLSRMPSSA